MRDVEKHSGRCCCDGSAAAVYDMLVRRSDPMFDPFPFIRADMGNQCRDICEMFYNSLTGEDRGPPELDGMRFRKACPSLDSQLCVPFVVGNHYPVKDVSCAHGGLEFVVAVLEDRDGYMLLALDGEDVSIVPREYFDVDRMNMIRRGPQADLSSCSLPLSYSPRKG